MRLTDVGEFALIEGIRRLMRGNYDPQIIAGIGDDCAILRPLPDQDLIITTDTLVEGIHFHPDWMNYYQIGWRALAANLSDIAAMAGRPVGALLACSFPASRQKSHFDQLIEGITALGKHYDCPLIGGDITRSKRGIFINITVIGLVSRDKAIRRGSAQVGDRVWVTGWLGEAKGGLEYHRQAPPLKPEQFSSTLRRFLQPTPRLEEAAFLVDKISLTSMIDLSDGLSSDLRHICRESGVGIEIYTSHLPISSSTKALADSLGARPVDWALHGGEDFELCFTSQETDMEPVVREFRERFGIPLTAIGRVIEGRELSLIDERGERHPLPPCGYQHFRK